MLSSARAHDQCPRPCRACTVQAFFGFEKTRTGEGEVGLGDLFDGGPPATDKSLGTASTGAAVGERPATLDRLPLLGKGSAAPPLGPVGRLVTAASFEHGAVAAVCLSTVIECMPYYGEPAWYTAIHTSFAHLLTWLFVAEMALKLVGLGCSRYWSSFWHRVDGSIVLMSIAEMSINAVTLDSHAFAQLGLSSTVRSLRAVRLVRVLRVLRTSPSMYNSLRAFVGALPQVFNLVLLLVCVVFVFAIIGMNLFGGTHLRDDSRQHFDSFGPAMLTVFNVFSLGSVDLAKACEEQVEKSAQSSMRSYRQYADARRSLLSHARVPHR